jgi:hypothetical protein
LAQTAGDASGLVIVHYDVKLSGEAVTSPRLRIAPFQEAAYSKIVNSVLNGRQPGQPNESGAGANPTLTVGDCCLLIDGGRSGHAKGLKRPWNVAAKDEKATEEESDEDDNKKTEKTSTSAQAVHVFIDEKSIRARRKKARGTVSLKQMETMHVITSGSLCLPERTGKHYSGTNKGTVLGPIVFGEIDEDWCETVKACLFHKIQKHKGAVR